MSSNAELLSVTNTYVALHPDETSGLERLIGQLEAKQKLNDRYNFEGHAAASGLVLSPDRAKILLIFHKSFNRWMQPGGHWESDEEASPLECAAREVAEETGVSELTYMPVDPANPLLPIHLETHPIPARPHKNEPNHYHHDFRYVFLAGDEKLEHQESEVSAAAWFNFDAPEIGDLASTVEKIRKAGFIH